MVVAQVVPDIEMVHRGCAVEGHIADVDKYLFQHTVLVDQVITVRRGGFCRRQLALVRDLQLRAVVAVHILRGLAVGKGNPFRLADDIVGNSRDSPVLVGGHVAVGIVGVLHLVIGPVPEVERPDIRRVLHAVGDLGLLVAVIAVGQVVHLSVGAAVLQAVALQCQHVAHAVVAVLRGVPAVGTRSNLIHALALDTVFGSFKAHRHCGIKQRGDQ